MVEHVGLAIEDDGVREELLGSEVRWSFEIFLNVAAKAVKVAGSEEFCDDEGEDAQLRWESWVREATTQISRMHSGFFSDLKRSRMAQLFCFKVRGVVELGERMKE